MIGDLVKELEYFAAYLASKHHFKYRKPFSISILQCAQQQCKNFGIKSDTCALHYDLRVGTEAIARPGYTYYISNFLESLCALVNTKLLQS